MIWVSDLVKMYPLAFGLLSLSVFLAFVVMSFVLAVRDYDAELRAASLKLDEEQAATIEPPVLTVVK